MCMGESRDPFQKMGGARWVGVYYWEIDKGVPLKYFATIAPSNKLDDLPLTRERLEE